MKIRPALPMTFKAFSASLPETHHIDKQTVKEENRGKALENLVKQLPAEATGVYLLGFDLFKGNMCWLTVAMLFGAFILVLVRLGLKSSAAVIFTSLISYVLWVYAIGNGPMQLLLGSFNVTEPAGIGTFLIFVWTTLVSIAANYGWIK